jgi:molybdopterin synthase catalytic subunit
VDTELDPSPAYAAVRDPLCGAIASFVGTARAESGGEAVLRLEYEVHETMALKQFARLAQALRERYGVWHVAIHHRRGPVPPGGASVAIAVAAPRRRPALDACADAIERLKHDIPIWKKEVYRNGHRWMEGS